MRLICLTEETTETLYALGAEDYIVGISGFTVRPTIARKTKPKISTYLDANIQGILALNPDIVLAWSDLQAPICAELIKAGIEVYCFNHRTIRGILSMIEKLGRLVNKQEQSLLFIDHINQHLASISSKASLRTIQPLVYFEEWFDPLITGISWVSEIIELCGGVDIFRENRAFPDAKRRILASTDKVLDKMPDIMIASWCGKGFKKEKVLARPGWNNIPAIKHDEIYHIKSSVILQPGPAALIDGATIIYGIIDNWQKKNQMGIK